MSEVIFERRSLNVAVRRRPVIVAAPARWNLGQPDTLVRTMDLVLASLALVFSFR